jgi:hypothetical protein
MSENGNKPEEKPIVQQPVAQPEKPEELTPEKIKTLDGNVRASLCAIKINEALKEFNCIFNPILKLDNQGHHILVNISGMSYADTMIPAINPFMYNA